MNVTDKKIRKMYRKKTEQLASEQGYKKIKEKLNTAEIHVKILICIAICEAAGIIFLIGGW